MLFTRKEVLEGGENLKDILITNAQEINHALIDSYFPDKVDPEEVDYNQIQDSIKSLFNIELDIQQLTNGNKESLIDAVNEKLVEFYEQKEKDIGSDILRQVERYVMLQTLDYQWKDHLLNMDHLREGVGLRGYAQKDPLREYKREGFEMFTDMITKYDQDVCENLFKVQPVTEVDVEQLERRRKLEEQKMVYGGGDESNSERVKKPIRRVEKKVGRNDPCPCGSGKKFKKCHGK